MLLPALLSDPLVVLLVMPPLLLCKVLLKLLQCLGIKASPCCQSVVVQLLLPGLSECCLLGVVHSNC